MGGRGGEPGAGAVGGVSAPVPTPGLRLEFEPGLLGLKFVADEKPYPEAHGQTDMAYINGLIESDERRRAAGVR